MYRSNDWLFVRYGNASGVKHALFSCPKSNELKHIPFHFNKALVSAGKKFIEGSPNGLLSDMALLELALFELNDSKFKRVVPEATFDAIDLRLTKSAVDGRFVDFSTELNKGSSNRIILVQHFDTINALKSKTQLFFVQGDYTIAHIENIWKSNLDRLNSMFVASQSPSDFRNTAIMLNSNKVLKSMECRELKVYNKFVSCGDRLTSKFKDVLGNELYHKLSSKK